EPMAPSNLGDLQMVGPTTGFAVGKGVILGTDDGHKWTPRYTGGAAFLSVDAVDALHAWAVGDRALYGTVDGGKHWVGVGSPGDADVNGWHPQSLQCARGGVVWALFTGDNAAASHAPYVVYRGTADGQWTAVMKEGMTAPKEIKAGREGGSYPGPMSALGPDS